METPRRSIRLSDKNWELLKQKGGARFIENALKNDNEQRITKIKKHLNNVITTLVNSENTDISNVIALLECIVDM